MQCGIETIGFPTLDPLPPLNFKLAEMAGVLDGDGLMVMMVARVMGMVRKGLGGSGREE